MFFFKIIFLDLKNLQTMNWSINLAFTIILFVLISQTASKKQGYAIKGKILCGTSLTKTNSTKLKLVDTDTGL